MNCPACGGRIETGDAICSSCGRELDVLKDGEATARFVADRFGADDPDRTVSMDSLGVNGMDARAHPAGLSSISGKKAITVNKMFVAGLAVGIVIAAIGGFGTAYLIGGRSSKKGTAIKTTSSTTKPAVQPSTVPGKVEERETGPQDVVKRYYEAVIAENYGQAKKLMTASTAGDYEPTVFFKEGVRVVSYETSPIAVDPDKATIRATENLVDKSEAAVVHTADYSLVKTGGYWLIEDIKYLDTGEKAPGSGASIVVPTEQAATDLVTKFLTAVKEKRLDDAKKSVTQNFTNLNSAYFTPGALPDLTAFEIISTEKSSNIIRVKVRETRGLSVGERRYIVVFPSTGEKIEDVMVVD